MKHRPIHQNLDTSFVNFSALIKYLRRRQFVGSVKIQLNGYKADIDFREDNQMKVSEHDQISGRISEGEEALQRLLIRAREPGGTINVYQIVEEKEFEKTPQIIEEKVKIVEPVVEASVAKPIPKPVREPIYQSADVQIKQNGNGNNGKVKNGDGNKRFIPEQLDLIEARKKTLAKKKLQQQKKQKKKQQTKPEKQEKTLPDFPFKLSNKVEHRAKRNKLSNEDWKLLMKTTVEILGVIDKSIATAKLDFTAAFRKARGEIAVDYPFLNPSEDRFDYANGRIKMSEKVNDKMFISGIMEANRRILDKLESNPKFSNVHRQTVQTLIALMNKRQSQHDKFSITPHLKRVLGI